YLALPQLLPQNATTSAHQRQRAQGHQPLDVRLADSARHARGVSGPVVRWGSRMDIPTRRRNLPLGRELWPFQRRARANQELFQGAAVLGAWIADWARWIGRQAGPHPGCASRSRLQAVRRAKSRKLPYSIRRAPPP